MVGREDEGKVEIGPNIDSIIMEGHFIFKIINIFSCPDIFRVPLIYFCFLSNYKL